MDRKQLANAFKTIYGEDNTRIFYAPGRVNLIGEHIDYNGGAVFPCALSFGTYAAVSQRTDNIVKLASTNFDLKVDIDINNIYYNKEDDWANYPKGIIHELNKLGSHMGGLNILFSGSIPNGSGLSSSASVEILTSVIFNEIFGLNINRLELVKLSQRAENEFVGVMCGIMDQFAIGMCKEDNAVLLMCNTLEYKHIPLKLGNKKLVIANTNKKRGLQDSKYNERRQECERALEIMQKEFNIDNLCDLTIAQFEEKQHLIENATDRKRAKHAVYENSRTKKAVDILCQNDLEGFGKLMNESHESLKNIYEVSCYELDVLSDAAREYDGCIGSRMTGAGFGGCTISIVDESSIDGFIETVGKVYKEKTGLVADFYVTGIGCGAKEA